MFRGSMQPDVSFFGFDLTVDQVVGTGAGDDQRLLHRDPGAARRAALWFRRRHAARNEGTHLKVSFGAPAGSTTGRPCSGGRTARTSRRCCASNRCASRSTRRSSSKQRIEDPHAMSIVVAPSLRLPDRNAAAGDRSAAVAGDARSSCARRIGRSRCFPFASKRASSRSRTAAASCACACIRTGFTSIRTRRS